MSSYTIEDAEAISRALSREGGEFEIPPANVRADLAPGDLATLLFNVEGRAPGEPLRVQVTEVEGPGQYFGRLVEETNDLFFGMPVVFDERNVAWMEPPGHASLSGLFDWARPKKPSQSPPQQPQQFSPWAEDVRPPTSPPALPPDVAYKLPSYPRDLERIPQESYPLPDVFYLPYHSEPGSGLVLPDEKPLSEFRREVAAPVPLKQNPFAIWSPEARKENLPATPEEKAGVFAQWIPKAPQTPIVAPPQNEPGIFSVWNPEAMAAEAAAMKEMDISEIMVPKSEQGSMYEAEGPDPFEIFKPEPAEPMPVAPSKGRKEKPTKAEAEREAEEDIDLEPRIKIDWTPPTVEWMAARLGEALNLKKVWKEVRRDRKAEWFLEEQSRASDEDTAPIPLHTIVNYEDGSGENLVENLFAFLDMDTSPIQPLLDKYAKDEDEEAWEELGEISREVQSVIYDAFEILKPDDLPGSFGIGSHDNFGNQEFIGYTESPEDSFSPEESRRLKAEREHEEKKEQEQRQKLLRKLLGSWRPMTWEEAAEFLDVHYGLQQLAQRFRKAKKTKKWAKDLEEYGGGISIVEDFGEDDGDLEMRVARFLGVPGSVVDRFSKEEDLEGLWEAALYPAFESFEEAWENVRPEDLPGGLKASSDEGDEFVFYYSEGERYNDGAPEEGSDEGDLEGDE